MLQGYSLLTPRAARSTLQATLPTTKGDDDSPPTSTSSSLSAAMVITRKKSASPDRDFDDHEYRDFEPPRQPEDEQKVIEGLYERTMNRHTEDPITNTLQKDACRCN